MPDTWNVQELREMLIRGDDDLPALQDSGLIDQNSLMTLIRAKKYHPEGLDSAIAQDILELATSRGVREAVQSGDAARIGHAAGRSNNSEIVDMADWNKYESMKDLFRSQPKVTDWKNNVFQCVLFSSSIPPTGRGKTSTAYTLIEIAQTVESNLNVITNNPSDNYTNTPQKWSDLETMIHHNDGWSILLMDEAAQFLQFADQGAGKTLSQKMKLLRHEKCHLILVGHTGKDIPADIRRQMYFIDKKSEKKAVLGYGLTKGSGDRMEVEDELLTLSKMPHTSIEYKSQGEKTINVEFDDGSSSVEDNNTQDKSCKAETNAGNPCPAPAEYPTDDPTVCVNHRHRLDDIPDGETDSQD